MKTVAFFSTKNELEILKKRDDFEDIKLIALTPDADFALDEFPNRKTTIEDYYCEKNLNIIGNNSLDKIKNICDVIDLKYLATEKLFSCSDIYMYLKTLYDQLLINHTFCRAIFEKEKPTKIIIFNLQPLSTSILAKSNDDLLINFIYNFFAKIHNVEIESLTCNSNPEKKKKINTANIISTIKKPLSKTKFNLQNIAFRIINFKEPAIYMLQPYSFETCLNLRKKFKLYWNNVFYKKHCRLIEYNLSCDKKLEELFTFDGCAYYDLVRHKINYIIKILANDFAKLVNFFSDLYIKKNIKAVIAAAGQNLEVLAGIKAANMCKLPTIWGQHGGFYGYANFLVEKYLHQYYTHDFVYTEAIHLPSNTWRFTISDPKLLKLYRTNRIK